MIPPYLIRQEYIREAMRDRPVPFSPLDNDALDQSGSGNNGTQSGGVIFKQPGPAIGVGSGSWNGLTSSVATTYQMPSASKMWGSIWMKLRSYPTNTDPRFENALFHCENGLGPFGGFEWAILSTGQQWIRLRNSVSASVAVTGTTVNPLGVWTHLAFSWDGSTVNFFRNSKSDGSGAASIVVGNPATALGIGGSSAAGGGKIAFDGYLAMAALAVNATLSQSRVKAHYNTMKGIGRSRVLPFGSTTGISGSPFRSKILQSQIIRGQAA